MLNKILGTAGTRILNAIINLVIVLLISRYIGKEGYGIIGLVIVSFSMIQIFVDLFGGGAIIYNIPRHNNLAVLILAYFWAVIVVFLASFVFIGIEYFFPQTHNNIIPPGEKTNILILAFINALMQVNYNYLIGRKLIKFFNIAFSAQIISMLIVFCFKLYISESPEYHIYIDSLKISYLIGLTVGFIMMLANFKKGKSSSLKQILSDVMSFGFIGFLANGFHILNKRISFYFVSAISGLGSLGVYNAAVQLSEGLRLISNSISIVQFSEISNSENKQFACDLTIRLMKLSVLLTMFALIILIAIPTGVYEYVFTKEFSDLKSIIIALSPGVVALSANAIFSHYFSGLGRPSVSLWANMIGFFFTILFAIILIPIYGFIGAAISTSVSYISTVIYQYFIFKRNTNTKLSNWLINSSDINYFVKVFKSTLKF